MYECRSPIAEGSDVLLACCPDLSAGERGAPKCLEQFLDSLQSHQLRQHSQIEQ